jgi:hypothetical protein
MRRLRQPLHDVAAAPLNYDKEAGRWGSFVWTMENFLSQYSVGGLFVCLTISLGAIIWILVGLRCWHARRIAPEISLFAFFAAGLLFQNLSFQRYVEPQLLLSVSIFCAREKLNCVEGKIGLGWFSAYGLLSFMKPFFGGA